MLRILFVFLLLAATVVVHAQNTVVHDINISGNKITKDHIILRELALPKATALQPRILPINCGRRRATFAASDSSTLFL